MSYQYWYKNEAATSLVNSNEPAITMTDKAAPLKSFDNPNTEKNAALPATSNAENPISELKFFTLSNTFFLQSFSPQVLLNLQPL